MNFVAALQRMLIVAFLLTLTMYAIYFGMLGRVSIHVMRSLGPAYHAISVFTLASAITYCVGSGLRLSIPAIALVAGLVLGYLSGLLGYLISETLWDFERIRRSFSVEPLTTNILDLCLVP